MLHQALSYIDFYLKSKNFEHINTNFLPEWFVSAINPNISTYGAETTINYLENLLSDKSIISTKDIGAGSRKMGTERKVCDIAKIAGSDIKEIYLLSKIAYFIKPASILELGTSLGVSTLSMANSAPKAEIYTIEGCPQTFNYTKQSLNKLNYNNIKLINSDFISFLNSQKMNFDFIYIDGDHRFKSTLELFSKCKNILNSKGVIIIDDIHWSKGMTKAWNQIKKTNNFLSIDIFNWGILIEGLEGEIRLKV